MGGVFLLWLLEIGHVPVVNSARYSDVLFGRDGTVIGVSLAEGGIWHFPPTGKVPEKFRLALLEFEDHRFEQHFGIDVLALARAVRDNFSSGSTKSGASTITMQLARLLLSLRNRGVNEKVQETLLALDIEFHYSKQEILRSYASLAPFGGNVVGIEAAAWRYFGRPAESLDWAEAATMAVLPNAPGLIHLDRNRTLLKDKRNRLLVRLSKKGYFDEDTLALSMLEDLPQSPSDMPRLAPHLMASIQAGVFSRPSEAAEASVFRTSLDPALQRRASQVVAAHMAGLASNGVHNAAVVILDNATSQVLAYVGNNPSLVSSSGSWVDVVQRPRSTGSLLKPFLYASMIDEGQLLPEQLVADVPTRFPDFAPENSTHSYRGAVPAYLALARSLNVPAIRLLRQYTVSKFVTKLKALGMTTLNRDAQDYGLPLIIGGAEGTLWDLAGMYASLARNAAGVPGPWFRPTPWMVPGETHGTDTLSPGAAYLTLKALLQVNRPGIGENWESYGSMDRIAWKTGTSQGYRDAWAIGVTKSRTVAVWVGNADGSSRPELGGTIAAGPLLFSLFEQLPREDWFAAPESELRKVEVCSLSGLPPSPTCANVKLVDIPYDAHLPGPCPYCREVILTADRRFRTTPLAEGGRPVVSTSWFVLPPVMEWYYRQGNADYRVLPDWKEGVVGQKTDRNLGIEYPETGSEIYIPVDVDGTLGYFTATAVHRSGRATLFWHLDKNYLGSTRGSHSMRISVAPGVHTLVLVDDVGETTSCTFTVLAHH